MFYYEEEEAGKRDAETDVQLHQTVCEELGSTMLHIRQLKTDRAVS